MTRSTSKLQSKTGLDSDRGAKTSEQGWTGGWRETDKERRRKKRGDLKSHWKVADTQPPPFSTFTNPIAPSKMIL